MDRLVGKVPWSVVMQKYVICNVQKCQFQFVKLAKLVNNSIFTLDNTSLHVLGQSFNL